MLKALWTAATGMEAQQLKLDVVANNLANISTTGFKKSRAEFQDLLYQVIKAPGTAASVENRVPAGIQLGLGVRTAGVQKLFEEGNLVNTLRDLDVAIEGDGFFQILLPDGQTAYTRAGNFAKDAEGRLVTADGLMLQPEIAIPEDAETLTVATDGVVTIVRAGSTTAEEVGQIQLARFVNPSGLKAIGRSLFLPSDSSGDPITGNPGEEGLGTLAQGFLETSNVNLVEQMVEMITSQRAYELSARVISSADNMLQTATRTIGG